MNGVESDFYKIGGTLPPDAPSYIVRKADDELYEGLREGRFCYVLTSRQMGKSSLRNRTAQRLRDSGIAVAELDLTGIGRNLTPEQWYDGLVYELGRELGIKAQLNACWRANANLGPLHRLMCVLQEGVLSQLPGRVIIFIDEIEVVRSPSFSFSADEFFAAIRACYNLRSSHSALQRLSFCLLGMAAPAELIQDARITPFNIGLRIELTDFTAEEAKPLARGLCAGGRDGEMLLERVLYWTGGHPYLTQRLCQAVAEHPEVLTSWGVDELCVNLFLTTRARESEANLVPVREYLLKNTGDIAGTLDLYQRVLFGKRVEDDETNPLVRTLCLSGITRAENGLLWVRNLIYAHVFDKKWIAANMPDAEIRRQKRAYRQGLLRAAAVASVIIGIMAGLIWEVVQEKNRVDRQARIIREAFDKEQRNHFLLYDANMNLAEQQYELNNVGMVRQLLDESRLEAFGRDLRGFEWRYLWKLSHREETLTGHTGAALTMAFSRDGHHLICAGENRFAEIWDVATRKVVRSINLRGSNGSSNSILEAGSNPKSGVTSLVLSPTQETISLIDYGKILLWDINTNRKTTLGGPHMPPAWSAAFSPDGAILASGSADGMISLWNVSTHHEILAFKAHNDLLGSLAFSPNGRWLATGSTDSFVKLWDVRTGRLIRTFKGHTKEISTLTFSADATKLASGSADNTIGIWDLTAHSASRMLRGHASSIASLAFSTDGRTLASGSYDETVRMWNVEAGHEIDTFRGHTQAVRSVAFSPDSQIIASGDDRGLVKFWHVAWDHEARVMRIGGLPFIAATLSDDASTLAVSNSNAAVALWDLKTDEKIGTFKLEPGPIFALAFSPRGRLLAAASINGKVRLWSVGRKQVLRTLRFQNKRIWSAAFAPDGRTLAIGTSTGEIELWDIISGIRLRTLKVLSEDCLGIDFSPDGRKLLVEGTDSLNFHDVTSGRFMYSLKVHDGVSATAFSNDGRWVAIASEDKTLSVHDVQSGKELWSQTGYSRRMHTITFSPDARTIATGSGDNTINLWDASTGRETFTLKGHVSPIQRIAFSNDGKTLTSLDNDGVVRIWVAPSFQKIDAQNNIRSTSD